MIWYAFPILQLFARITKLGWFDVQEEEYVFRNVVSDVTKFIQVGLILIQHNVTYLTN